MNRSFVSSFIKDQLYAVDIGARGDIPKHWLPLDGIARIASFDADVETAEALREKYDSRGFGHMYEVHPVALGKADEKRKLYLAKGRGASSLYRPDSHFIREYVNDYYCEVERTVELDTRHAGNYFRECGISDLDLLKIDIQGAELEVLQALSSELLGRALMIETEIQFHDRGNGAPAFCDLHQFLLTQGFSLLDIDVVRHHPTTTGKRAKTLAPFGVEPAASSISKRVWYGDAVYYRGQIKDDGKLRNLVVSLCLYGFFTEAYKVLQKGLESELIGPEEYQWLLKGVVDWHGYASLGWRHGNALPAKVWRWLLRKLDLQEQPRRWSK